MSEFFYLFMNNADWFVGTVLSGIAIIAFIIVLIAIWKKETDY